MKSKKRKTSTLLTVLLIVLMVFIALATISCLLLYKYRIFSTESLTLAVSIFDVLASIGAGSFIVVQLQSDNESDKKRVETEEAKFILEYNSSFIENKELCAVEHYLEDRLTHHGKGEIKDLSECRQSLVNYLVYLEGFASCVQQHMLELEDIDNLFSYRFFLAMNHPEVQELELLPYADFYRGSYQLYDDWYRYRMEKNGMDYIDDCEKCDSIMPLASSSLFLYPQFERYLSAPINVKVNQEESGSWKYSVTYTFNGKTIQYNPLNYSQKKGMPSKERIDFVIKKQEKFMTDVLGKQFSNDDYISRLQYEQIAQLIYETDPFIYPALFGEGLVGIENAKHILPGVFEAKQDAMFSKKNLFLFLKRNEVIGLILWIKGDISWDTDPLLTHASEIGISLIPEHVSEVAKGYVGIRYNSDASTNNSISLVNICVKQSLRGIGIGKLMLDEFISLHKHEAMKLCVLADNSGAIKLYERVGFGNKKPSTGFSLDDKKPNCFDMERSAL